MGRRGGAVAAARGVPQLERLARLRRRFDTRHVQGFVDFLIAPGAPQPVGRAVVHVDGVQRGVLVVLGKRSGSAVQLVPFPLHARERRQSRGGGGAEQQAVRRRRQRVLLRV